jgi:hypothetical protein
LDDFIVLLSAEIAIVGIFSQRASVECPNAVGSITSNLPTFFGFHAIGFVIVV